MPLAVRLAEW